MTDEELIARYNSTKKTSSTKKNKLTDEDLISRYNSTKPQATQPSLTQQTAQPTISQPTYANHGAMAQQGHNQLEQKQAYTAPVTTPATPTPTRTVAKQQPVPTTDPTKLTPAQNTPEYNTSYLTALKDTASVLGHAGVTGTAKVLDAANSAIDYITANDTALINPDKLLNYSNGERGVWDKRSYNLLRDIAEKRPNDLDLQFLYNAVTNGTFQGTAEDAQRILDKSQKYYHDEIYNALVQPSEEKKEAFYEELATRNSPQAMNLLRGFGSVAEPLSQVALAGAAGASGAVTMGVGGAVQGKNKMQQYLESGKSYKEAAKEVPIETAKGLVYGAVLNAATPIMAKGLTPTPSTLGEAFKNIVVAFRNGLGVGAMANTSTQLLDLLKDDPNYDYINWNKVQKGIDEGKYNTVDDYLNSSEFAGDVAKSRLTQLGIASAITGGFNAMSQIPSTAKVVKDIISNKYNEPKQLEADLKILGLDKNATNEEVKAAYRKLVKQYHSDVAGKTANSTKFQEITEAKDRIDAIQNKQASSFIENVKKWFTARNTAQPTTPVNTQGAVATDQALVPYAGNTVANVAQPAQTVTNTVVNQVAPTIDNANQLPYNNIGIGETKNVPTKDLLPLTNGGGYRTEQEIAGLRDSILKNGITDPIELVRKNDGSIEIESGNHRIQIANELGIKEVPVTFVESWENIGKSPNILGGERNGNAIRNNETNSGLDVESRDSERRIGNGDNQLEKRGTPENDAGVFTTKSQSNQLTNNNEITGNNGIIENSNQGSFLMPTTDTANKIQELNADIDLTMKAKDQIDDEYYDIKEQYEKYISTQEYKDALKNVTKYETAQEIESSPEYKKMLEAQRLKDKLTALGEERTSAIKRIEEASEQISKLEKEDRTPAKAIKEAKKALGTTNNFKEAGYLLTDGTLLDFSGRTRGSNSIGKRTMDHREINEFGYDMDEFINLGNIRLQGESNGIQLMQEPNDKQIKMLKKFIDQADGNVYVDIYEEGKMRPAFSKEYDEMASTRDVLDDIDKFFRNKKKTKIEDTSSKGISSARLQKETTSLQEESKTPLASFDKNMMPTTDELKQFEQGKKKAEIDAIREGAKALGLEKTDNLPVATSGTPPTEPPENTASGGEPPEEPPANETDKIAQLLKERPQKAKMTKKEIAENAYKTLVNKGYFVDKLADTSGNQELKYKYDRMLASANEGNYVVGEKQTDNDGNIIGKSVNEIWKPVEDAGKVEEFSDYLLHKLNIDRMSLENIDNLTKAENEFGEFVKNNPDISQLSPTKIKKLAEGKAEIEGGKVKKINNNLRDVITKEAKPTELQQKAQKFLELERQVEILENRKNKPVFGDTVTADDSRKVVAEYEEKYPEFKKWDKDIKTFNKNQLQNMVDAGLTNEETQELLNNMYDNYIRIQRQVGGDRPIVNQKGHLKVNSPIKKAKGGNQDILPLKDSMAQQAVEVKKAIARNKFGLELLDTIGEGVENPDYGEVLKEGKKGEAPTFTVFKDGKPVTMKINQDLYEAIKPAERTTWEDSVIAHGLQKAVVLQKTLLTSRNPIFAFTNFVRDLQTAVVNSKDTPKMLKNYAKLVKYKFHQMYSEKTGKPLGADDQEMGRLWELYKANGGESNTYFDFDKGTNLERPKNVKGFIGDQIDKIFEVNEVVEQLPRVAEFITTLENGGSIDEAMYNAADVTVNFKRGGEFTKMLDRNGASFLNASVQGIDKQIRNFADIKNGGKGWAKMVITCAMLGIAPQLVNHLLLSDDEDYQDLPDYIKDNYWLFKIGDNKFLRIPRGRDIPTFLGTLAQRTSRAIEGDDRAFDGIVDTFNNTLAPNNPLDSNIFSPISSVITNRSWNGNKIVSSALENKEESEQYDAKDTEFAKWLGKKLNYSPKKIDYLIDQYSGGIGDILIPFNTKYAEENNPLSSKFTTDSIASNKQLSRFYDDKTKLSKKKVSGLATDTEQYQYKYLNDIGDEISEKSKKIKEIEMSDISDKEKIKQVTQLRKEMNELARTANKNLTKYGEAANDYSDDIYEDIFDSDLYKNARDQEQFEKKIRNKVSTDANTKAKEALGNKDAAFNLNTTIEELDDAGIPLADYYLSWYAANNLAQGSTYASRQKAIRDYTDLTPEQEETLFEIFNIQYKKGSK